MVMVMVACRRNHGLLDKSLLIHTSQAAKLIALRVEAVSVQGEAGVSGTPPGDGELRRRGVCARRLHAAAFVTAWPDRDCLPGACRVGIAVGRWAA